MVFFELNNGIKMPALGMGTLDEHGRDLETALLTAINSGYQMIDTAQMYGNEADIGGILKKNSIPREKIFLVTKIFETARSYEKAKEAIDRSLSDLQVSEIDLLLLHMPYEERFDMYRAMEEAYEAGKAKAIGVCNFKEDKYLELIENCRIVPVADQYETHVFQQNYDLQKLLENHGTRLIAWSPLAKGRKNVFKNPILLEIAEKYHKSTAQIMLRNLIDRGISAIPRSVKPERIRENIDIFDFMLEKADMEKIRTIDEDTTLLEWTKKL